MYAFYQCLITVVTTLLRTNAAQKKVSVLPPGKEPSYVLEVSGHFFNKNRIISEITSLAFTCSQAEPPQCGDLFKVNNQDIRNTLL